ncbi:related to 4-coumarate-CoA ligase [Phialocephala subalpina]|uniref:Related to 4-coumarate-CoA ligase n=1 Tax=Phialocephala subalpina TaxID=576137 RepID=A0A1L7XVL0_9HELO|nr:related to 4-coumarate-CoA ligase [Phialocephala subalpina]
MAIYVSNCSIELQPNRSISELMEHNVCNTSESKIIYEDTLVGKTATYGGFRQQVARLAWGLKVNAGLKKGDIVAITSPSCIDYLLTVHAVCGIKSYSAAPLKAVSRHRGNFGKPPVLFCIGQRSSDLSLIPEDISTIDSGEQCFGLKGQDARKVCAAIIMSSGTTGSPKAVMLSHHNLVSSSEQMRRHNPENWNGEQREIFLPLMFSRNATLARIVPTIAKALSESPLVQKYTYPLLQYFSCSTAPSTVSYQSLPLVHIFANHESNACERGIKPEKGISKSGHMPKSVCSFLCFNAIIQTLFHSIVTDTNLAYGCTEVSGAVAQSGVRDTKCPLVRAGSLIANVEMKLVDEEGRDIVKESSGEILIKGPNVMMGYKGNTEASAECKTADGEWYRTGDVGKFDKNGYLTIVDRIKGIIKFQVAPTELEEIISRHPTVSEVCVIGVWNEMQSTEVPRAFIVLKSPRLESTTTASQIDEFVKSQVAGYKALRGGICFVQMLPKSPTGKILRKELRKEDTADSLIRSNL